MLTIKECRSRLKVHRDRQDDEAYHCEFDTLIEERLRELDPAFMDAMSALYEASGMARWCA